MIITVGCNKGGTGKTFTASLLLEYLNQSRINCCGVDLDPQQTLYQRYTSEFERGKQGIKIYKANELREAIEEENRIVIVDTPPANSKLEKIFEASDLVIIPCNANMPSIVGMQRVRTLLGKLNVAAKIFINEYRPSELADLAVAYVEKYLGSTPVIFPPMLQLEKNISTAGDQKMYYRLRDNQIETVNSLFSYLVGRKVDIKEDIK